MNAINSIHPKAQLGTNVHVGNFSTIEEDVQIGNNVWIGNNVTIHDGARIGNDVKIFAGAVIAGLPQDLKFDGEYTTAEIGDGTTLREFVTVNRGTTHRGKTVLGKNNLLLAYCHVAHDCIVGNHVIMSNATQLAGHVVVEDHATISGLTGVHQFVRIGAHSMVAGAILVRKDVPPFVTAAKDPTVFSGVNVVGLRRRGYSSEQIRTIQDAYAIIYKGGMNFQQSQEALREQLPASAERDQILAFYQQSERGVIPGRK